MKVIRHGTYSYLSTVLLRAGRFFGRYSCVETGVLPLSVASHKRHVFGENAVDVGKMLGLEPSRE